MKSLGGPAWYEIRVAGVPDGRWAAWFDGLQISGQGEETVILAACSLTRPHRMGC